MGESREHHDGRPHGAALALDEIGVGKVGPLLATTRPAPRLIRTRPSDDQGGPCRRGGNDGLVGCVAARLWHRRDAPAHTSAPGPRRDRWTPVLAVFGAGS